MNQIQTIQPMKRSIWDYLFYASLLVITIWLILKVTGVIQTPAWLEFGVPIAGGIITFLTFYHGLIDRMFEMNEKLLGVQNQTIILGSNDDRIEKHLEHIDKDVECLKTDVGLLKTDVRILKTTLHTKS